MRQLCPGEAVGRHRVVQVPAGGGEFFDGLVYSLHSFPDLGSQDVHQKITND